MKLPQWVEVVIPNKLGIACKKPAPLLHNPYLLRAYSHKETTPPDTVLLPSKGSIKGSTKKCHTPEWGRFFVGIGTE